MNMITAQELLARLRHECDFELDLFDADKIIDACYPSYNDSCNDDLISCCLDITNHLQRQSEELLGFEESVKESSIDSEKLKSIVLKIFAEEAEHHKASENTIKNVIAFILKPFKFLYTKMVRAVAFMLQPFKSLFNKMFGSKQANLNSKPAVAITPVAGGLQSGSCHTANTSDASISVASLVDLCNDSFDLTRRSPSPSPSN